MLIPFLPNCFVLNGKSTGEGKTTLSGVFSHLSVTGSGGVPTLRLGRAGLSSVVLFVEAIPARAVQWSKPVDLALHDFADPSAVVHARSGKVLVGLRGGKILNIPAHLSPDDWRSAIHRGDLRPLIEHNQP